MVGRLDMSGHHWSGASSRLTGIGVNANYYLPFLGFVVVVLFLFLFSSYTVKSPSKHENLKHADMVQVRNNRARSSGKP